MATTYLNPESLAFGYTLGGLSWSTDSLNLAKSSGTTLGSAQSPSLGQTTRESMRRIALRIGTMLFPSCIFGQIVLFAYGHATLFHPSSIAAMTT